MDLNTQSSTSSKEFNPAHVTQKTGEWLKEGKKAAYDMFEEGKHKMHDAQATLKNYGNDVSHQIQKQPLTSVLLAAGLGWLISKIWHH